jgi:hypothetical protein
MNDEQKYVVILNIDNVDVKEIYKEKTTFENLQGFVGGYIEHLLPQEYFIDDVDKVDMWCDEEGKLKDLPINPIASVICGQTINGTVLFTKYDDEGNTIFLTEEECKSILINLTQILMAYKLYQLARARKQED